MSRTRVDVYYQDEDEDDYGFTATIVFIITLATIAMLLMLPYWWCKEYIRTATQWDPNPPNIFS